ncbi:MAG: hypothetical protein ACYSUD_06705 [Planctomycetota bacterium]
MADVGLTAPTGSNVPDNNLRNASIGSAAEQIVVILPGRRTI